MERHLPIVDLNTGTTNHPEYFGDGVHPNDGGYLVMAELVKAGLEREPLASITMPVMGAMLPAGMIPITASATGDTVDIASVELFDGATSVGKLMAPPWTFGWQAALGVHDLSIKAVDTTLADATSAKVSVTITEAVTGGGAGAGVGGAASGGGAGMSSGGTPAGASAGGSASGGGGGSGGPSSAGSASGGVVSNGVTAGEPAAGCGCAVPARRTGGVMLVTLALGALWLRRRSAA
jgi:hypothetical protein